MYPNYFPGIWLGVKIAGCIGCWLLRYWRGGGVTVEHENDRSHGWSDGRIFLYAQQTNADASRDTRATGIAVIGGLKYRKHCRITLAERWRGCGGDWWSTGEISFHDDASVNENVLALARLDFDSLQKLNQKEICDIARWWKDGAFTGNLPFVRNRNVLELPITCSMLTAKPKELELFTKALDRGDVSSMDGVVRVHEIPLQETYRCLQRDERGDGSERMLAPLQLRQAIGDCLIVLFSSALGREITPIRYTSSRNNNNKTADTRTVCIN
ncbi:hypothetical protein MLD38_036909 [Melastoma candidum]|uniref:Uncharacterized protein n=1 Tax=Melastoma candidum TaxID=119954 RepID=A0ACB9LL70_9MYRT|nr:hypothetical protein MLD38_036909 [Melastoma candidum]